MANIINFSSIANTYIERSSLFNAYMNDIKRFPLLSREEEEKLLLQYKNSTDDQEKREIRDKLLKHNQRFIVGAAKQYANNSVDTLLDLIGETNLAFIEAIESYDTSKKIRLLSWAAFYIRRSINIYLYRHKNLVRRSYDQLLHTHLAKARNILAQREGREVTDSEILEYLEKEKNIKLPNVSELSQVQVASIDKTTEDDDFNSTLSVFDMITSIENDSVGLMDELDNKTILKKAMSVLDEREKEIFTLLYGLNGTIPEITFESVGAKVGCGGERVRQIHNKGLAKMKAALKHSAQ